MFNVTNARNLRRLGWAFILALSTAGAAPQLAPAEDFDGATKKKLTPGSVQVSFLPPPVREAIYSVGIYEAKTGKLVRRLHEMDTDEAFTAGLNGLVTQWDRKTDSGKTVPAGKYTARGWAVGEKLNVEGVDILGNDWVDEDGELRVLRVVAIGLMPADGGLAVLVAESGGKWELLRLGPAAEIIWRTAVEPAPEGCAAVLLVEGGHVKIQWPTGEDTAKYQHGSVEHRLPGIFDEDNGKTPQIYLNGFILPAEPMRSEGKDNTSWELTDVGLQQFSAQPGVADRKTLRTLLFPEGEPRPLAVSASPTADRLYLLEEIPGWQRVRGLEWSETKQGEDGQPVSEWKTFFERSIRRPDPALGLEDPAMAKAPSPTVEVSLGRNPLEPGKRQSARLRAGFDEKGSFLETADGLRLLQISELPHLRAVRLVKGSKGVAGAGALTFYQTDGAAWDEFALTGIPGALMSFDAGEFELTATGEKRPEGAPTEPRDL